MTFDLRAILTFIIGIAVIVLSVFIVGIGNYKS